MIILPILRDPLFWVTICVVLVSVAIYCAFKMLFGMPFADGYWDRVCGMCGGVFIAWVMRGPNDAGPRLGGWG